MAIGKGIELDVDVTRFNSEVHDHIVRTGLRNLLMDAHASATAKADPDDYVKKSRELAEKKLAVVVRGGRQGAISRRRGKHRLIQSAPLSCGSRGKRSKRNGLDIAAAPKDQTVGSYQSAWRPNMRSRMTRQLRPRAEKIVALENVEAEPLPVKKAGPAAKGKKAA